MQVAQEKMTEMVGTDLGYSDWLTIDQARVDAFADATLDHQFIHIDPDRARLTPWGTTVAHGFLTLSLLPHLTSELALTPDGAAMSVNYGANKIRFPNAVKVGSEVRAHSVVGDVVPKGRGRFLITYDVTVEIKGESKPALVAAWMAMVVCA